VSNRIGELIGLLFEQPDSFKRITFRQHIEPLPDESFFVLHKMLFKAHVLPDASRTGAGNRPFTSDYFIGIADSVCRRRSGGEFQ